MGDGSGDPVQGLGLAATVALARSRVPIIDGAVELDRAMYPGHKQSRMVPKSKSRNSGKLLEGIVATLERVLSGSPATKIETNKRLVDKVGKRMREHDVVLTTVFGHHTSVTAIECRHRSRAVGSEHVEAFATKCQHTGVNLGVIVSSTGFTSPARKIADHFGIKCIEIADVPSFDWLRPGDMTFQAINFDRIDVVAQVEPPPIDRSHTFEILDPAGVAVSMERLCATAQKLIQGNLKDLVPGTREQRFRIFIADHKLRDRESGALRSVLSFDGAAAITITETKVPFEKVRYSETGGETIIADAAVAVSPLPQFPGKLVFTQRPGEGAAIHFEIGPGSPLLKPPGNTTIFPASSNPGPTPPIVVPANGAS